MWQWGWCLGGAYFLAKFSSGGAYSGGAYKKSVYRYNLDIKISPHLKILKKFFQPS